MFDAIGHIVTWYMAHPLVMLAVIATLYTLIDILDKYARRRDIRRQRRVARYLNEQSSTFHIPPPPRM